MPDLPDVDNMPTDELLKLYEATKPVSTPMPTGMPDINNMPTADLLELYKATSESAAPEEPASLGSTIATQAGSGAVESTAGLLGLLHDYNPLGGLPATIARSVTGLESPSTAERMIQLVRPITAEPLAPEDPNYIAGKLSRTVGEFAGPTVISGGLGTGAAAISRLFPAASRAANLFKAVSAANKIGTLKNLFYDLAGAGGAELGEYALGGSPVGRLIGGIAGASGASTIKNVGGLGRARISVGTEKEIRAAAGEVLRNKTDLTEGALTAAEARAAADMIPGRSTAELTEDVGMAQIEDMLKNTYRAGENLQPYTLRTEARENLVKSIADMPQQNKEEAGSAVISLVEEAYDKARQTADEAWQHFNPDIAVDTSVIKKKPNTVRALWQEYLKDPEGIKMSPDTIRHVERYIANEGLDARKIQNTRSYAGARLRETDAMAHDFEKKVLGALQGEIIEVMDKNLSKRGGKQFQLWSEAREATRNLHEKFGPKTTAGRLLGSRARASSALAEATRDARSIKELEAAVGPQAWGDSIQRTLRESLLVPLRDSGGNVVLNKNNVSKLLNQTNLPRMKQAFGEQTVNNLQKLYDDIASEGKVYKLAHQAGGSPTFSRQSVAAEVWRIAATPLLWRAGSIGPVAALGERAVSAVAGMAATARKSAIEDALFKAAIDPSFAKMLLAAPTKDLMLSVGNRLADIVQATTRSGVIAGNDFTPENPVDKFISSYSGKPLFPEPQPQPVPEPESNNPSAGLQGFANKIVDTIDPAAEAHAMAITDNTGAPAVTAASNDSKKNDQTFFINDKLMDGLIKQESAGNEKAVSDKGAKGLTQMTDIAARELERVYGKEKFDASKFDPFDAKQSREWGKAFLELMLNNFDGDLRLALAAYNGGETYIRSQLKKHNASSFDEIEPHLYKETREYVSKVLNKAGFA